METFQISSKHTFMKLSVDAGFQKKKGFFKVDVLYKTVKKARQVFDTVGTIKFSIPPRSPDFNPIENIFSYVKSELRTQNFEKKQNIMKHLSNFLSKSNTLLKILLQIYC